MTMKIGCLGAGAWGFCLAMLLAEKGYQIYLWPGRNKQLADLLESGDNHPKLQCRMHQNIRIVRDLKEAFTQSDFIVESVTAEGLVEVFSQVKTFGCKPKPIVLTSKGIERQRGLLLHELLLEILPDYKDFIGCISGPSLAKEVHGKQPTSVVCSAYSEPLMHQIQEVFNTDYFRVYPNSDIKGVSFGGAMKNIIAIACGIAEGLGFEDNSKAALMTRGLAEIRRLAEVKGCNPETLNGLSGLGDLCATCSSSLSRNHRFGKLIASGEMNEEEAKEKIGMVVEGIYTCMAAYSLGKKHGIPLPITEAVYSILREGKKPRTAVKELMTRPVSAEVPWKKG